MFRLSLEEQQVATLLGCRQECVHPPIERAVGRVQEVVLDRPQFPRFPLEHPPIGLRGPQRQLDGIDP